MQYTVRSIQLYADILCSSYCNDLMAWCDTRGHFGVLLREEARWAFPYFGFSHPETGGERMSYHLRMSFNLCCPTLKDGNFGSQT